MKLPAPEERSNVPLHVPRTLIIGVPYLRRVKAAISKNKSRKPSIVRAIFHPSCSVLLTRGDRASGSTGRGEGEGRERRWRGGGGHVARRYYARERALRWMAGSYPTHRILTNTGENSKLVSSTRGSITWSGPAEAFKSGGGGFQWRGNSSTRVIVSILLLSGQPEIVRVRSIDGFCPEESSSFSWNIY